MNSKCCKVCRYNDGDVCMQTNVAENDADLTVAQVMVVLNVSQQDIAELLGILTA